MVRILGRPISSRISGDQTGERRRDGFRWNVEYSRHRHGPITSRDKPGLNGESVRGDDCSGRDAGWFAQRDRTIANRCEEHVLVTPPHPQDAYGYRVHGDLTTRAKKAVMWREFHPHLFFCYFLFFVICFATAQRRLDVGVCR
jgi:hypothetical protein